jgi:type II secretory pathway component GspD/PulD (secretin)
MSPAGPHRGSHDGAVPALGRLRARVAAIAAVLLAGLASGTAANAQDLQVIDLEFRRAEELIPILEPLLEPGGALTGMDDVLFVRASPANFEQIRQAVATLDRAPRQLLITVGQGTVRDRDATQVEGSATIGDDDVQVGVNRPPGAQSGAEVAVRSRRQEADLHNLSSVRVLEGIETWIAAGRSVPITETWVSHGAPGGVVHETTTWRDVDTGFYATARVSGDRVILEISSRQQQFGPSSGAVATQGATSSVTTRLGEWFELGAVEEVDSGSSNGLLVWGRRNDRARYSAWVKVDEL